MSALGVGRAQAYDLSDPWVNCGNAPQTVQCPGCDTADPENNCLQPYYMGPSIHPRLKKPVGQRLAAAALSAVYGWPGPVTGPTLAGCSLGPGTLTLAFNASLLAGAPLLVQPYDLAFPNRSGLSVLVNASADDAGSGVWVALNLAAPGSAGPASVDVDLSPLRGTVPQAVKYAWGEWRGGGGGKTNGCPQLRCSPPFSGTTGGAPNGQDVTCCSGAPWLGQECVPGQCPLLAQLATAPLGGLPANPFFAEMRAGKCVCPAPQACDA